MTAQLVMPWLVANRHVYIDMTDTVVMPWLVAHRHTRHTINVKDTRNTAMPWLAVPFCPGSVSAILFGLNVPNFMEVSANKKDVSAKKD